MRKKKYNSKSTECVHSGGQVDKATGGVVSPIYPSTAIDYISTNSTIYPRYYNTPNQEIVAEKLASLENGSHSIVFSSGLAAIITAVLALLKKGDHAIFQHDLYGGTQHTIKTELPKFGIDYSFVDATDINEIREMVRPETRLIFIESPSNPLLRIVDIAKVSKLAGRGIITMIDNTFASPINQNPLDFGIDIVMHSGTKYLGGHSDLICGVLAMNSKRIFEKVRSAAINYGGTVNALTCHLLERSLKTLSIRVDAQNRNAFKLAKFLDAHPKVNKVFYPGLKNHEGNRIAKKQMRGFGGMIAFEIKGGSAATKRFIRKLKLIRSAVSLGGVETILCVPAETSHAKLSEEERKHLNISDGLIRMSVGIEGYEDLEADINSALK